MGSNPTAFLYLGLRFAKIRCNVRRCMFNRRAVSETALHLPHDLQQECEDLAVAPGESLGFGPRLFQRGERGLVVSFRVVRQSNLELRADDRRWMAQLSRGDQTPAGVQ